jgi:predicted ATPase/DNA-binding CsgD family transcriptional regulator
MSKPGVLIEPLTNREREILAMLVDHCSNKEIASSLNLSVNSVKWYARQIYGKLGVENRHQVAARASELGLLTTSNFEETNSPLFDASLHQPKHNLPLQLTSFIGRAGEIQQVRELLGSSRLVTLTGAGGVGKTRLALAVAWQGLDDFADGLWLVELAPVGDPDVIPGTIATLFGVQADQNRSLRTALLDYLREKQLLLILDNCEHLINACAEMAETILQACPQVRLLASSREALGIDGEVPFYVPSLSFPELEMPPSIEELQDYEAVQLFLERAHLVLPEFALTVANASSLAKICHRLDGIPLALELAAARLQVLSPEQIAARLDDRFRLLTGGSRRAMPRHQTLHALIDWSYELLSEAEATLFRRLSVFAGGWTLQACEAVCADERLVGSSSAQDSSASVSPAEVLDVLGGLVNKSLITVEREGDIVHGYLMLETMRQYAQEKLVAVGEAENLRDRHLDYFVNLVEESEPLLRGPEVFQCLELLDDQLDNLRLALGWAFGGEDPERVARGLRLGSALRFYWYARSLMDEGVDWLKRGLERATAREAIPDQLHAGVLLVMGFLIIITLDFTRITQVQPLLEKGISLFQKCNDLLGEAFAQCELGICLMAKYITSFVFEDVPVEYPMARSLAEQGLATCRELGKPHDLDFVLFMNMSIYFAGMECEKARAYGEEALALCEKLGDKMIMGLTLMRLGAITLTQGDLAGARSYIQKGLLNSQELKDKYGVMAAYTGLGSVDYFSQDFARMEAHFTASLLLSRDTGSLIYTMFSLRNLGIATMRLGKLKQSSEYYLENDALAEKVNWMENEWVKYDVLTFILGMAGIAFEMGDSLTAARLLGSTEAQFEGFFKPLDSWDQAEFNRIAAEVRSRLDESDFTSAWATGRGLPLEQAIEEALQVKP